MEIWEVEDDDDPIEGLTADGRPDPTYASALGLVMAPLGRRAAAAAIDVVGYLLLQIPYWFWTLPLLLKLVQGRISWYGFVNHPDFILAIVMLSVTGFLSLVYGTVQLVLHGRKGVTLGKAFVGIRTVNVKTLERPGFWRGALRDLVLWGSSVLVVGPIAFLLSPLLDREKRGRGWHDRVGHTWCVDVRHGLDPYDEKRMRIARKTLKAEPVAERRSLPSLTTQSVTGVAREYQPAARVSAGVLGAGRSKPGSGPEPGAKGRTDEPAGGRLSTPPPPSSPDASVPLAASSPTLLPPPPLPPPPPPGPSAAAPSAPPSAAPADLPLDTAPTRVGRPAPAPAGAAQPAGAGEFVLELDSGQRIDVEGVLLLGRNPSAVGSLAGARAVPITDETWSVSKTHLAVRPVEQGIEVVDHNSTNGTFVWHDGSERRLVPGEPSLVPPDHTLRFGDRTAVVRRS